MHQIKSECSKLSLKFELSFLYALFLATARHGQLRVEFSLKEIFFLVILLLACEKGFTLKINSKGYR